MQVLPMSLHDPETTEKTKYSIAALIIAKDEADMIVNCIETLQWCDEVVVLDDFSDDATPQLARQAGAHVIPATEKLTFAQKRMLLMEAVDTEWIVYIDADERVTPALAREISVHAETHTANAMELQRRNVIYGKELSHGGWDDDRVIRVFHRLALDGWFGEVHESPEFTGEVVGLHTPLIHLTHRSTQADLLKSAEWTPIEARLIAAERTEPVTVWTLARKTIMELVRRVIFQKAYKDGMEGWIEAMVQAMNRFMVYVQVWEFMQEPSLKERYQQQEEQIAASWDLVEEQKSQRGYRPPQGL